MDFQDFPGLPGTSFFFPARCWVTLISRSRSHSHSHSHTGCARDVVRRGMLSTTQSVGIDPQPRNKRRLDFSSDVQRRRLDCVSFLLSQLPETMTDALISEAKRSPAPGPADSETRKEVFIACIHRPGFDSCVPNIFISEKNSFRYDSDYNLQRNWPHKP
jgi:hypothetical protein